MLLADSAAKKTEISEIEATSAHVMIPQVAVDGSSSKSGKGDSQLKSRTE